jgi:rubrerythrin
MSGSFNVERVMDTSGKVDLTDIDWAEVPRHPLTPEALRALRYFMITEGSTFFYTRALMKTRAAMVEPELAPFISVWMYEEEFHGRAFRKFLEAYGERVEDDYRAEFFRARGVGEHIDELSQTVLSQIFRDTWPVVHMVWGVVQEMTTYMAYQALIERTDHPVLSVICQRIMKQELRHYTFYRDQAARRLEASALARQVATYALKLGWTPVGDGMSPRADVLHAISYLFDGLDGPTIRRIEQKVQSLPGLEWFDMFTTFAREHQIRRAPREWFPAHVRAAFNAGKARETDVLAALD